MELEIAINNGNIQISEEVISSIVAIAIEEEENFSIAQENLVSKVFQKNDKIIKVETIGNSELNVTANVYVKYGVNIQEESNKLQKSIAENIEIMTGLNVKKVDLFILSIVKEK